MSSVPLIKIEKKVQGKIDQAKLLLSIFCKLYSIKMSDSELTVLAYFMVYKLSSQTEELILKSKVLANEDSLKNTMSKLRKVGLIIRKDKRDYLNDALNIPIQPVIGLFIKLDNS